MSPSHFPNTIVGFGPIPARILGFLSFILAFSTAMNFLNVTKWFFELGVARSRGASHVVFFVLWGWGGVGWLLVDFW